MKFIRLSVLNDWFKEARRRYLRFTIAAKLLLAFFPLSLIIVVLSIYTLSSLVALGDLSRDIVENNMRVLEATDGLTDILLAQESFGRRYMIMKSEEMQGLFWKRSAEFEKTLKQLRQLEKTGGGAAVKRLSSLHARFNDLYREIFDAALQNLEKVGNRRDAEIRRLLDEQLAVVKNLLAISRKQLADKLKTSGRFSAKALYITAVLSFIGVFIGIGAALLITRSVSRSINQLKLATAKFSERQFDFIPDVAERDEFGMLSRSFIAMAQRLARLEVMDLDANPLTRLPGGGALENVLKQRLDEGRPIAFCLLDIDNFKSYNDRYGYAKGNEVIKRTAKIIETVLADHGSEDAFLGHIGGDDFAIIVSSDHYVPVCEAIIEAFDREVPGFYDEEDRKRGYITAKTRQGDDWEFPLMTISIAVVTNRDYLEMNSIQMGEIAAEIKEHAKTIAGSLYMVDRRKKEVEQNIEAFSL